MTTTNSGPGDNVSSRADLLPDRERGDATDRGGPSNTVNTTVEEPAYEGMRVDRYVADVLGLVTRSQLKARHAVVYLNEKPVKLSKTVTVGDAVTVVVPEPEPISLDPEPMDLDILYEDRRMLVVNKPAGLVVHPGNGHPTRTLVHGILHHVRTMRDHFGAETARPGIVHRLDKDTSGVIVIAKDTDAHEFLSRQFRDRRTEKLYLAVVHGFFRPSAGIVAGLVV
ncbi:MAG: pseudouridine synthase, partial [Spirochaetota bacterium]